MIMKQVKGLDPNDNTDRNGDKNGNGYTNLEDYINGLITFDSGSSQAGIF